VIRRFDTRRIAAAALAVTAATASVAVAFGLAAGGYNIDPSATTGGGGTSAGGDYVVQGAIGQPFAGSLSSSGYVLSNGIFAGAGAHDVPIFRLFAPALTSNP